MKVSQIRVIAVNTWKMTWRDPLGRLELALLSILTILSAIAAIGSPTAGDAQVQMYAISYASAPFALVLLIGHLGQKPEQEVAWWSRPVPRSTYIVGRALGFVAVGIGFVIVVGVLGWIAVTLIAGTDTWIGLGWTAWFIALTAPSLILVTGFFLWLRYRIGNPSWYYPLAIVIALIIAFWEYKISLFVGWLPHLPFWNPFPGFLSLGLALPPGLVASPGVSGWLWLNRLFYSVVGMQWILWAKHTPYTHYASSGKPKDFWLQALLGFSILVVGARQYQLSQRLAPTEWSTAVTTPMAVHESQATVVIEAKNGSLRAHWSAIVVNPGDKMVKFELNAGLRVTSVTVNGHPILFSQIPGLVRNSSNMIWHIHWPNIETPVHLKIGYTGHLLPQPSTLPYPPWELGSVYNTVAIGSGHLYIAGAGNWLPVPWSASSTRILLTVTGLASNDVVLTTFKARKQHWVAVSKTSYWVAAPLSPHDFHGFTVWTRPGRPRQTQEILAGLAPYEYAYQLLKEMRPQILRIELAPSPVITHVVSASNLILWSEVHPYTRPIDPITGTSAPETLANAMIAVLRWTEPNTSSRTLLLTALVALAPQPLQQHRLVRQIQQGYVPSLGSLTPHLRQQILSLWNTAPQQNPLSLRQWLQQEDP
ncbi:MAG: hypothetical protein C7B46_11290 [Sulfobacillus benefaciens]|uniref:Uncharacterized protein n=1 Tax=Sulfobacillus benefaciens TaxID=453960 RepID=A0A2T2XFB6_9FIRM|nr:MAG: hypothetical protein C7B46_11290 [Sulfobacillus benefaciens]